MQFWARPDHRNNMNWKKLPLWNNLYPLFHYYSLVPVPSSPLLPLLLKLLSTFKNVLLSLYLGLFNLKNIPQHSTQAATLFSSRQHSLGQRYMRTLYIHFIGLHNSQKYTPQNSLYVSFYSLFLLPWFLLQCVSLLFLLVFLLMLGRVIWKWHIRRILICLIP